MSSQYDSVWIVFNPNSTGDAPHKAHLLSKEISKALPKVPTHLKPTKYAGHAAKLARTIAKENKSPLIISVSGDGGYHEVINGAMSAQNNRAVFAVEPAGNANDHARTLHGNKSVSQRIHNKPQPMSLLKIKINGMPEKILWAHSYAGIGITADVAKELNKVDLNKWQELKIVLSSFWRHKTLKLVIDSEVKKLDSLLMGNINQMAKVLTIAKTLRPNDDMFDVLSTPHRSRFSLIKSLFWSTVGEPHTPKKTKKYQLKTLSELNMQLDGEVEKLSKGSTVTITSKKDAVLII